MVRSFWPCNCALTLCVTSKSLIAILAPLDRTMPTPDDAVLSPAEHERATCPPDEPHTSTAHSDSSVSDNVDPGRRLPAHRLPTPPPHGSREQSPSETHSKPSSASREEPHRDIPTPMTVTDDNAEDQRALQASPLSATAPAPNRYIPSHLAAPFSAHRVCDSM